MAGPRVISKYRRDGGYFVQFKKDASVITRLDWIDPGCTSH